MSTKKWLSWVVVAAMTTGGAGFALGGAVLGARAAAREPAASRVEAGPDSQPVADSHPVSDSQPVAVAHSVSDSHAVSVSPSPAPTGELSIRRMQVTSGIDHREPIDHPASFGDGDERVYAFVDVANPSDAARELAVTFANGQRTTGHVTLEVPAHSARFRTWAWTQLSRSPGEWTAIVRDENGVVVATDAFEIR